MHVIFGTGALGLAVMRELLRKGERVKLVSRASRPALPAGVELANGDAKDEPFCVGVCSGASVVYNCTGLPYAQWPTDLPGIQRGIIAGAAASGAKLIYADNLYAYGPCDGPLHEERPDHPVGEKTAVRAKLARMVLQAHAEGKVRAAIGRGPAFYGPHVRLAVLGERVFRAALAGRPAEAVGDIDQPHTHIYIDDFARGLVTLAEREEALGQVWHIPAAETVTTRQLMEMAYREAGHRPKYRIASGPILTVMGWFVPMMREFKEIKYMLTRPFVADHRKFEHAFGAATTPHAEAIRRTVEWYRSEGSQRLMKGEKQRDASGNESEQQHVRGAGPVGAGSPNGL